MLMKLKQKIHVFSIISVIAGLLIVMPLLNILVEIVSPSSDAWKHIRDVLLMDYIINTISLIILVAIGTGLIGLFSAYVIARYDFKGRKLLSWMLILPLAVPSYIAAYVYADMTSYTGTLSRFFRIFNLSQPLNLMNLPGAAFIFTMTLYPYVYMMVRSAMNRQSASYTESARLLGTSNTRIFLKIVLPLLRPALIAGMFLVVLETLNDYGVVAYFNVRVFSFAIFNAWFNLGDVISAIRLSAILLVLVFFIVFLERVARGRRRYHISVRSKTIERQPLQGRYRVFFPLVLWVILGLGFIVPTMQLLWYLTLTYKDAFSIDLIYIILNSLTIAIFATLLVIIIALALTNFARFKKSALKKSWLKITTLGYAIPGAVIAIAVHVFFVDIDRALYPIYQWINPNTPRLVLSMSLSMLVFAYVLRFMAIGYNTIEAAYDKIGERFTEAGYSLHANKFKTLFQIDLPLLKSGMISAAIIVFIDVFKELPLTLILRPPNYDTLASRVYEYASDEMIQQSSLASLVLILISGILIYILTHQKKKEVVDLVRKHR